MKIYHFIALAFVSLLLTGCAATRPISDLALGAGGAALMAIGSFTMGRGFGKWVFTAIGLLMVSGVTRLLEYWIAQGTGGVT